MGRPIDLAGMKFGRLTVIGRAENDKHGKAMWICKCDCGNITKPIRGQSLKNGNTISCGCYQKEVLRKLNDEQWQDDEFKKMHREASSMRLKEKWKDEEYKKMKSDKMKELNEKLWEDALFRQTKVENAKMLNYKGGITQISTHLRDLNKDWNNKCKQEANYTCQLTGKRGVKLRTHHLYAFSLIVLDAHNTYNIEVKQQVKDYTEEELKLLEDYVAEWHKDSSNAVVLSEEAHKLFHSKELYGYNNNTPEQYEEFRQRYINGEFKELI